MEIFAYRNEFRCALLSPKSFKMMSDSIRGVKSGTGSPNFTYLNILGIVMTRMLVFKRSREPSPTIQK